jgi:hypothetical protein
MIRRQIVRTTTQLFLVLLMLSGCESRDVQLAREAANRQAQQNTEMTTLNKEVASGAHQLVAADAQARKEIINVHHELQAERSRLDTSHDALEKERQNIASERQTDSILTALAPLFSTVVLVVVLLGFCWSMTVAAHRRESSDFDVSDLLVRELVCGNPSITSKTDRTLILPTECDPGEGANG